jgi:hypothetical protein
MQIALNSLIRKFRTARRLPLRVLGLALATLEIMLAVRVALWLVPFRRIRRVVESRGPMRSIEGRVTARQIAWMVQVASRYIPRSTCLTQALTAQLLLNAAGIQNQLRIGVARGDQFESHAWIECEGRVLVGGAEQSARYTTILTLQRP